jgi:hypothetical protein
MLLLVHLLPLIPNQQLHPRGTEAVDRREHWGGIQSGLGRDRICNGVFKEMVIFTCITPFLSITPELEPKNRNSTAGV